MALVWKGPRDMMTDEQIRAGNERFPINVTPTKSRMVKEKLEELSKEEVNPEEVTPQWLPATPIRINPMAQFIAETEGKRIPEPDYDPVAKLAKQRAHWWGRLWLKVKSLWTDGKYKYRYEGLVLHRTKIPWYKRIWNWLS